MVLMNAFRSRHTNTMVSSLSSSSQSSSTSKSFQPRISRRSNIMLKAMLVHVRVPLVRMLINAVLYCIASGPDASGGADIGVLCNTAHVVSTHNACRKGE